MQKPVVLPEDYYLTNFQKLLGFVEKQYADLLSCRETDFLNGFWLLEEDARKLYVRLAGRKGPMFRSDKLSYPEITSIELAVNQLVGAGFMQVNPPLDMVALSDLMTKSELLLCFPDSLGPYRRERKQALVNRLVDSGNACPDLPFITLQPQYQEELRTLLFLFFGNLRQDLTEFVLQDLGLTRFENYPLKFRLFNGREELKQGLSLSQLWQEVACENNQLDLDELQALAAKLPPSSDFIHPVFKRRHARLANAIARDLERQGALREAIACFQQSYLPPSRERQARIMAKLNDTAGAIALCEEIQASPASSLELAFAYRFSRILKREKRRRQSVRFDELALELNDNGQRVEFQVQEYFSNRGWQVFYVENALINGLVGLWFWDIIFADREGAFFQPFQSAPSDLMTPDFYQSSKDLIDQRLSDMSDSYLLGTLLATFNEKQGISNRLVHWPALSPELITLAVSLIPVDQLRAMFQRLIFDIAHNRTGFPDLILFDPENSRYQWLEVKGPGDKLQENQKLWLVFFQENGIPAEVVYVRWI
ncbi:VRR-NUC domain-containing protein [Endozoicomonas sp. SCSIO W0465]|uniref:VRR-NUC domain-containing protein n=1 Tax=Endozoicomonas sp. SCSIO W0465 TaxID=2918516 RepID=UPI00207515BD|nr:VRR-NUC domain-containing protein [Endozoicomonas sp. SCSIO W0465]USE38406.1 VRR-NUC domain-containing protein [Endozoicomonas sp. SCSIO W0465]